MNNGYSSRIVFAAQLLSRINTVLTVCIFVGCAAIIAMPFWSSLNVQVRRIQDNTQGLVYETRLAESFQVDESKLKPIPQDKRLVIPKIFVDGPISDGEDKEALDRGYWRRTPTVDPLDQDNFVIAGHRNIFTWTLYDLDKLVIGDSITIYWEQKEYNYRVTKTFIVPPSAVEIEAPTQEAQLTIYTCTPVLTAENRLVVIAKPM